MALTKDIKDAYTEVIGDELIQLATDIEEMWPSERVKSFNGAHAQSLKALAYDAILCSALDAPLGSVIGRPSDMRESLPEEWQEKLSFHDMTDSLDRLSRTGAVVGGYYEIQYKRGRPSDDTRNAYERRPGVVSVYTRSPLLDDIDSVLQDHDCLRQLIDCAVRSGAYYRIVRYCVTVAELQAQKSMDLFYSSHRPFFKSRGIDERMIKACTLDGNPQRPLTRAEIDRKADACARHAVERAYEKPPLRLFHLAGLTSMIRLVLEDKKKMKNEECRDEKEENEK